MVKESLRLNDRSLTVVVSQNEQFIAMPNQNRIIGICFGVDPKTGKRNKGEDYYPLEWLNKDGSVKKDIEKFIEQTTMNFTRVYKYITNTSVSTIKELNLKNDDDMVEAICLMQSEVVFVKHDTSKYIKKPLITLELKEIQQRSVSEQYLMEIEVGSYIKTIKDVPASLDMNIILWGYDPTMFKSETEKFIFLVKKAKENTKRFYKILQTDTTEKITLATINICIETNVIKKIENGGYFYGTVYLGNTIDDIVLYFQSGQNAEIVNRMKALIPEQRKRFLKDIHLLNKGIDYASTQKEIEKIKKAENETELSLGDKIL